MKLSTEMLPVMTEADLPPGISPEQGLVRDCWRVRVGTVDCGAPGCPGHADGDVILLRTDDGLKLMVDERVTPWGAGDVAMVRLNERDIAALIADLREALAAVRDA